MTKAIDKKARRATWAWALWDWAEQPYPTLVQTFIFATYITSDYFGDPNVLSAQLGIVAAIAGAVVAVTAPVFGRRSDTAGNRKRWLLINTGFLIAIMMGSYFVGPKPELLIFGLVLYGIGSVVQETAFINYYAMINQVTTPKNIGKVSGLAWGLGYVGGIILLLVALVGFVLPENPWFGISTDNAENIRVLFLFSAVWMAVFSIPLALFVPEAPSGPRGPKVTIVESYKTLFRQIAVLRKSSPDALKFLIASAVYRDGLAGVFTFGAILGAVAFGFSREEVIFFGIGANIVAGLGAALGGFIDDRIGTKRTIIGSLGGLVIAGLGVFAFAGVGQIAYWVGGLALCLFVGPAQASSRVFIARFTPEGREGEFFGLYQTTGRAVSFLSPTLWTVSLGLAAAAGIKETAIFGILGIVVVLIVGLVMMSRVHAAPKVTND